MLTPAQAQWVTLGFIVAIVVLCVGYDVLAVRTWGYDASISRVMQRGFTACPFGFAAFIFGLGVYVGHVWLSTFAE